MSETMVERMARAMHEVRDQLSRRHGADGLAAWECEPEAHREWVREEARAVLRVMREPMEEAFRKALDGAFDDDQTGTGASE